MSEFPSWDCCDWPFPATVVIASVKSSLSWTDSTLGNLHEIPIFRHFVDSPHRVNMDSGS